MTTEREFMQTLKELATLNGWRYYHTYDSRRSDAGMPDIVMVRPPRVIFAELKSQKGRVTPAQGEWLDALADCPGVETHLWRPSDWEEIVTLLGRDRRLRLV